MRTMRGLLLAAACVMLMAGVVTGAEKAAKKAGRGDGFAKTFGEAKADLGPTGRNDYFILEPGYTLTLEGTEDGKEAKLVITVLPETKTVDGVPTRVVEERESQGGKVVEISRNYYAISAKTHNVYYFGEDSKEYENGKVTSSAGSWESGAHGARYGLFMPARPKVGEKYYEEIAPQDKAMDRAETVSLTEKVTVPAGTFENCLKVRESSAVEKGEEFKLYAPGVGLLQDGGLKLTKYGKP